MYGILMSSYYVGSVIEMFYLPVICARVGYVYAIKFTARRTTKPPIRFRIVSPTHVCYETERAHNFEHKKIIIHNAAKPAGKKRTVQCIIRSAGGGRQCKQVHSDYCLGRLVRDGGIFLTLDALRCICVVGTHKTQVCAIHFVFRVHAHRSSA